MHGGSRAHPSASSLQVRNQSGDIQDLFKNNRTIAYIKNQAAVTYKLAAGDV